MRSIHVLYNHSLFIFTVLEYFLTLHFNVSSLFIHSVAILDFFQFGVPKENATMNMFEQEPEFQYVLLATSDLKLLFVCLLAIWISLKKWLFHSLPILKLSLCILLSCVLCCLPFHVFSSFSLY